MNNLTKRETILIIVLINLIAYYLLFSIVIFPILSVNKEKNIKIEELKAQNEIQVIEATKLETDLNNLKNLTKDIESLYNKIFSNTNQENIHYFLNNVAKETNTSIVSIDIKTIEGENTDGNNIENDTTQNNNSEDNFTQDFENSNTEAKPEKDSECSKKYIYDIKLVLLGSYKDKINFLKHLEDLNKTLKIDEIEFLNLKNESSKIGIKLYTITKQNLDSEFKIQ